MKHHINKQCEYIKNCVKNKYKETIKKLKHKLYKHNKYIKYVHNEYNLLHDDFEKCKNELNNLSTFEKANL